MVCGCFMGVCVGGVSYDVETCKERRGEGGEGRSYHGNGEWSHT